MIKRSTQEEGRLRVLEQVLHGKLSQAQDGLLARSVRQVRRPQRRYEAQGSDGRSTARPHDRFEGRGPRYGYSI